MREIKFRVWDKTTNSFFEPTYEAYKGRLEDLSISLGGSLNIRTLNATIHESIFPNRFEPLEQFIGGYGYTGEYKDRLKNKVELYEGDIVESWSEGVKGIFTIKLRQEAQPTFMLYPNGQHGKMWSIHFHKEVDDTYYDDLKVIGNIHEKK